MTRRLDLAERFFRLADQVSGLNFVMFAELDGDLDPLAVRAALDRAQHAHPMLRVRISNQGGTPCFDTADASPIQLCEVAVSDEEWQALIEQQLGTAFRPGEAPLIRCLSMTVRDQGHCVLALVFHHAIADGRSGASLLRELLADVLTDTVVPPHDDVVSPPLHDLFPPMFCWDEHPDRAAEVFAREMALLARCGPARPYPHGRDSSALRWIVP